jgi:hypothetical protein
MGIKWAHADTLDNGPVHLKANTAKIVLIKAYAAGDSYVTVTGNQLAEAATVAGDFTLAANGSNRRLTSAAKSGPATATVAAGLDLHFAFLSADSRVLYVTDETTDMAVTSGNTINFPALQYNASQPV